MHLLASFAHIVNAENILCQCISEKSQAILLYLMRSYQCNTHYLLLLINMRVLYTVSDTHSSACMESTGAT